MTTGALVMMVLAMTVLWGGLTLAVFNITRTRPSPPTEPASDPQTDDRPG